MSDRPKRKLIEVALPLEAINKASAREKTIRFGHPTAVHVWWARRPLAACRAVIFASLVDDPSSEPERFPTAKAVEDERSRLFEIIERLIRWESSTDEAVLEEARAEIRRSTGGQLPSVLDPFCGGGSIPLEAQRLGLRAYGSDLNPVAVLITKALVEIPPRFADRPPVHPTARRELGATGTWNGAAGLAADVRNYGQWLRDEAERRIGHLYPKITLAAEGLSGEATVIAWLWARTMPCPNPACGHDMPLVRSFLLSPMKGREAWVEPIVDRTVGRVRFVVRHGAGPVPDAPKIGRGSAFRCVSCRRVASDEQTKAAGRAGRFSSQLMAIVAEGDSGRLYISPTGDHDAVANHTAPLDAPAEELSTNPRWFSPPLFGLTRFQDLFTSRQLMAMETFVGLVAEARQRAETDARSVGLTNSDAMAYGDAIATYLALAVSRLTNYNSTISVWDSGPASSRSASGSSARTATVRNAFARQSLAMTWDYAEANPFSNSGGSFDSGLTWLVPSLSHLVVDIPGFVRQQDAASIDGGPFLISTDPPYYDNIGYADLSDFFYVWLRRMLADVYPSLFSTILTPKSGELVATPHRFGGDRRAADRYFESGLGAAFARAREISHPDFPLAFFYAFKQSEAEGDAKLQPVTGWETMLEGLLKAGFSVEGTWPIRTEQTGALKKDINALASSIVLVCRPRDLNAGVTTRKALVDELKRKLPNALRSLQHGNIAPVDLAQASIGPGMSVFSRYARVLEPDGSAMRVRAALTLINQALDEILAEQEGEFDADTRWAIAWYEQFGLSESAYGTAETLSKAKNSSVAGLVDAGVVAASRGRVRLLARDEYSADWIRPRTGGSPSGRRPSALYISCSSTARRRQATSWRVSAASATPPAISHIGCTTSRSARAGQTRLEHTTPSS